jgi:hypothetical protein
MIQMNDGLCQILLVCQVCLKGIALPTIAICVMQLKLLQIENMVKEEYRMKEHLALGRIVPQ